ncbi:ProQ/FinO family protein [Accumulibacter sp.]|uniref:ProQ/FinO family protein n=1 Tax=Accumulibacter sp. TaxID=2053492 RepID=UPI002BB321C6|nr:ProQ/FinO family protein [Accumulibacter sp.]HNE40064.1 ProQ/FinO family protein [Accumulibacter sp.]
MNTTNPGSAHSASARQLLKDLHDSFPVLRDCRPLAIGIDKQLLARLPDLDRKHLRIALGIHTHSLRYLKAIEKAQVRLDLEGNPAGEVTPEQRVYASQLVKERLEKQAAQRRAQREADALARQHAEKLGRLVEKFGRLK